MSASLLLTLLQKTRQAAFDDFLRLLDYVLDHFSDAFDGIDQAGVLTERKRGIVDIAGRAGRRSLLADLTGVLAQGPFAPRPALDELVALCSRHRAGPDALGGDIRDFSQHGIVTVAFDNRLLEIGVNRRFRRGHETGTGQRAFGSKSQRRREAAAVGDTASRENR